MRPRDDTAQIARIHKTDFPVGQATWLYEKCEQWNDPDGDPEALLSRDETLDDITLYWLTAMAGSLARIYWQKMCSFREHEIEVSVEVNLFPRNIYLASRRCVVDRYPTLVHFNRLKEGGYFAAWEQPELFAEEVRAGFRSPP